MLLDHVSAHQLSVYATCPRLWYLERLYGHRGNSVSMAAGKLCHNWIAEYLLFGKLYKTDFSAPESSIAELGSLDPQEVLEAGEIAEKCYSVWLDKVFPEMKEPPLTLWDVPVVEYHDRFNIPSAHVPIDVVIDYASVEGLTDWKTSSISWDLRKNWSKYNKPNRAIQSYIYSLWHLTRVEPEAIAPPQFTYVIIAANGKWTDVDGTKTMEQVNWFINEQLEPTVRKMLEGEGQHDFPASGVNCVECPYLAECQGAGE